MRLLHMGLFSKHEPQMGLRNALKKISTGYFEFSWVQRPRQAAAQLEQLIKKHKPDTVFMQIQTPGIITASLLKKYPNISFFNFNGDVRPEIPKWHFEVAPYCVNLFTNTDWVKEVPGAKYMQVSCDMNIYKPTGKAALVNDVVFLGNNHGSQFPLSAMREEMGKRFRDKSWFQLFGRGWGGNVGDLNYKQQQEAEVYRGAKIGINLSHMDLGSYTSDRMFRIMACGTMCLAYRHKDIEKEFIIGKHIDVWSDLDELESKIEHYLRSDATSVIAANGCKLVHEKYNWIERLRPILLT